jgi:hypothetical protein
MSNNASVDEIRWAELRRAALACGIDPDTLPSPEAIAERQKAAEPEPEPDVTVQPLTKAQVRVLAKALPPSQRHFSKIPMDQFLNGCLFGAASDWKWSIMPRGDWSVPAFTSRFKRWCLSGSFTALLREIEGAPAFDDRLRALFRKLAERERWYQRQVEDFRLARRKELAQSGSFMNRRGV